MWNTEEKILLNLILDEIIPPSPDGRVPGGSAKGVAEFIHDAGRYADDPVGAARKVLACIRNKAGEFSASARSQRIAIIKRVEEEESGAFNTLLQLAYMGYYSRPEMRIHFGLAGRPVHPEGYQVDREDKSLMDDLAEPVRARGSIYRDI